MSVSAITFRAASWAAVTTKSLTERPLGPGSFTPKIRACGQQFRHGLSACNRTELLRCDERPASAKGYRDRPRVGEPAFASDPAARPTVPGQTTHVLFLLPGTLTSMRGQRHGIRRSVPSRSRRNWSARSRQGAFLRRGDASCSRSYRAARRPLEELRDADRRSGAGSGEAGRRPDRPWRQFVVHCMAFRSR